MPFESSTPLVIIALVAAVACGWYGFSSGARGGLIAAGMATVVAAACFIADRAVVTDREYLDALFPRLAAAAETKDIDTLLAAIAPELRPLRDEVTKVMDEVKPKEVRITRALIEIAPTRRSATADLIVRVSGMVDKTTQGAGIAGVLVTLEKRDGQWLITDAQESDVRPGGL